MKIKSSETKYVGVILDNVLNWEGHLFGTADKANKPMRLIQRLALAKWGCMQNSLIISYNTYVKPILKYVGEVVVTVNEAKMDILEGTSSIALG